MKLVKVLDKQGSALVADPINQNLLRELVTAEYAVSDLAQKLNLPTLNVWRRMQKLQKANLIELTATRKKGNLEKKFYRSTATYFAPEQYFTFTPKNPKLSKHSASTTKSKENMKNLRKLTCQRRGSHRLLLLCRTKSLPISVITRRANKNPCAKESLPKSKSNRRLCSLLEAPLQVLVCPQIWFGTADLKNGITVLVYPDNLPIRPSYLWASVWLNQEPKPKLAWPTL